MEAITHNERILIHGDYDVDGIEYHGNSSWFF